MTEALIDAFSRYRGEDGRKRIRDEVSRELALDEPPSLDRLAEAQALAEKVDERIAMLLDKLTGSNRELVDRRLRVLERQRLEAERQVADLELLQSSQVDEELVTEELAALAASLPTALLEGTQDQRIALVRRSVSEVKIREPHGPATVSLSNLMQQVPAAQFPRIGPIKARLKRERSIDAG